MTTPTLDAYGIGHALVDLQYAVPPEFLAQMGIPKGVMSLIDQARQVELATALAQEPLASCSGGSAANTLIGIAAFGGTAHCACLVGDDAWGSFYLKDLEASGVGCSGRARTPGLTGQCTVLVTPDADRTLNTFLGVGSTIGPKDLEPQVLRRSRYVYLEGYLVTSDNGMQTCLEASGLAHEHGVPVALTLSDPALVHHFRDRFTALVEAGVDLLFCNEDEALAYTATASAEAACDQLGRQFPRACITRGARGAVVLDHGASAAVSAVPVRAVDTTGAGDLFAGGVLYGLTHGLSLSQAGKLGCHAAAQVVARLGCRLDRSLADQVDTILGSG